MTALICGSMAFDTVMVFPGRFKDHILADKIHMLNVSFLVPTLRRNYGGCAGNIAYNLKLLGGDGHPMAAVGLDFGPYDQWLAEQGISREFLLCKEDSYTAQAFITTDLDDNQITAFHPGAMNHAHELAVPLNRGVKLGIVAPDGRDAMIRHAEQFAAAGIPFFFDPGQGLPMFDGEHLQRFIDQATWVAVNDYEGQLLQERTGLSAEAIAQQVKAYIVTRGAQGSTIYTGGARHEVPTVPAAKLVDPTGCGDSYRAGLIYGLQNGLDWPTTGRIASLLGAIKIAHAGTQNHRFTKAEFQDRFQAAFNYRYS
jgi:adenosine kinase